MRRPEQPSRPTPQLFLTDDQLDALLSFGPPEASGDPSPDPEREALRRQRAGQWSSIQLMAMLFQLQQAASVSSGMGQGRLDDHEKVNVSNDQLNLNMLSPEDLRLQQDLAQILLKDEPNEPQSPVPSTNNVGETSVEMEDMDEVDEQSEQQVPQEISQSTFGGVEQASCGEHQEEQFQQQSSPAVEAARVEFENSPYQQPEEPPVVDFNNSSNQSVCGDDQNPDQARKSTLELPREEQLQQLEPATATPKPAEEDESAGSIPQQQQHQSQDQPSKNDVHQLSAEELAERRQVS